MATNFLAHGSGSHTYEELKYRIYNTFFVARSVVSWFTSKSESKMYEFAFGDP